MKKRSILAASIAFSISLLSGCAVDLPLIMLTETTYEQAASNRFVSINRTAIDSLIKDFDVKSLEDTPVLVSTIVNINDTRKSTPLGRTLSEMYSSYLSKTGFNVREIKLRGDLFVKEETGELLLSREVKDIAKNHRAKHVLVGTYSPAASVTYVSLKFIRTEDGRIIRSFDYALPNDRDVNKLLQAS